MAWDGGASVGLEAMVAGSGVEVACIKEGGFHRLSEMRIQDKKKVSERVRESPPRGSEI